MAIRTLSQDSVRMAKHFFVNFDVFKSSISPGLINKVHGIYICDGVREHKK